MHLSHGTDGHTTLKIPGLSGNASASIEGIYYGKSTPGESPPKKKDPAMDRATLLKDLKQRQ